MRSRTPWWFLLLCALFAAALPAQKNARADLKFIVPDKFERATKVDDQGLVQWDAHKQEKCPSCNGSKETVCAHCDRFDDAKKCPECQGKRKAVCRTCAGLGYWPDPLEKALCPECMGAGLFVCMVCGGRGGSKVEGSGDKMFDCVACKGVGAYKCATCNGARLVETVSVKPSLKDAGTKELQKAREQVDALLKALEGFHPSGANTRKEVKELTGILDKGAAVLPPMKRAPKALEDVMNKVYAGTVYKGHEENEANVMKQLMANTVYYCKSERRMLELCEKRAEANEKTLAAKKPEGKK